MVIGYKLNQPGSSYLTVIGSYGMPGTSNDYLLDNNSSEITINVENYLSGFYTVGLVYEGQIVDTKTLIID